MPFDAVSLRIGVVILAAGASSRMGQPKLLLPWNDTSVLGDLLNQWKRSPLVALGRRSRWNACSFSISSTTPPWPCTIAFGSPVVPLL